MSLFISRRKFPLVLLTSSRSATERSAQLPKKNSTIDRHLDLPVEEQHWRPNALVKLQAHYHHCGEAASEKCLSAATFVRWRRANPSTQRTAVWS